MSRRGSWPACGVVEVNTGVPKGRLRQAGTRLLTRIDEAGSLKTGISGIPGVLPRGPAGRNRVAGPLLRLERQLRAGDTMACQDLARLVRGVDVLDERAHLAHLVRQARRAERLRRDHSERVVVGPDALGHPAVHAGDARSGAAE